MNKHSGCVAFIDDDAAVRVANSETFELAGIRVLTFASAQEAVEVLDKDFLGVVVSDIRMPGIDGLQLFRRLRNVDADIPFIFITGHGDIEMAVAAMHDGAYDFIAKPYSADRLLASVRHAIEKRHLVLDNRRLRLAIETADNGLPLIGGTPAMERLRQTVHHIASADVDVLVEGDTGTGKEVVANTLHRWSNRRSRPFVAINCGALPESVIESELFGHEAGAFTGAQRKRIGRIEHANGGTLFLDEVESMPLALQVKLLRVLEAREITPLGSNEVRPVDIRVVAATKVDLRDPARRRDFREDLFYRLNVVTIRIPPLCERRADIPLLFAHFLGRAAARFGLDSPPVMTDAIRHHLMEHNWPGNVRELVHFAERVALGLNENDFDRRDAGPTDNLSLDRRVELYEAQLIREALAAHSGNMRATVEALAIPRKTLYDKLHRHGIDQAAYRPKDSAVPARACPGKVDPPFP
jgi:two-component system C4-dicarboxylate transport response regulator DctD